MPEPPLGGGGGGGPLLDLGGPLEVAPWPLVGQS